jgi:anti-sigma factor RsiW
MKEMNCKRVNRRLLAYLDGEVSPRERKRIQAHLSTCSSCRRELAAMATVQSRLRQGLAAATEGLFAPPEAWEELKRKLGAAPRTTFWELTWKKLKAGARKASLFIFEQPVWRKVLGTTIALGIAVGLVVGVSELLLHRSLALAEGIIENDPQVQTLCGGEVKVLELKLVDGRVAAVCTGEGAGGFVVVEADRGTKKVTRVQLMTVRVKDVDGGKLVVLPEGGELVTLGLALGKEDWTVEVRLEGGERRPAEWPQRDVGFVATSRGSATPPLTGEKVAWIVESAKSDPQVQELLKRGGRITAVTESYGIQVGAESTAEAEIASVTLTGAQIMIEQDGKRWIAKVTPEGEVTGITEAK